MSWLFVSGSQSIGASASASVRPMNIQGWFLLGLTGWISLLSKGLSRVFSSTIVQKHQFFGAQPFFIVQLSHLYMTTGKTIALTIWTLYQSWNNKWCPTIFPKRKITERGLLADLFHQWEYLCVGANQGQSAVVSRSAGVKCGSSSTVENLCGVEGRSAQTQNRTVQVCTCFGGSWQNWQMHGSIVFSTGDLSEWRVLVEKSILVGLVRLRKKSEWRNCLYWLHCQYCSRFGTRNSTVMPGCVCLCVLSHLVMSDSLQS